MPMSCSGGVYVRRAGDTEFRTVVELFGTMSPSKFVNIRLKRGDRIFVHSPGGGYGALEERAEGVLKRGFVDGFVSAEGLKAYGRGSNIY